MPEISRFLGIVITMYYREHCPPHFHVRYNEYEAEIDIKTLNIIVGKLPAKLRGLVVEWAELYKDKLIENWDLMQAKKTFNKIPPLV
jgi:hypothetical protein